MITTNTITNEKARELHALRSEKTWSWYELGQKYDVTMEEAREIFAIIHGGGEIEEGDKPADEFPTVTPTNPANTREIEMMMGKAVCAWANWRTRDYQIEQYRHMAIAEYEATARCIAMFVREPLWKVCSVIIERAKAEFGIE